MDFVTYLPRSMDGHVVWVIVNRLTKSAYFLAVNLWMSMIKLAQLYIKEIVIILVNERNLPLGL